jgi:leucyl-tRNA synthetase
MQEGLEAAVLLLSPIVPHIAEVLWTALGHAGSIVNARWPEIDPDALEREAIELTVQVNGKKRASLSMAVQATDAEIRAIALADANVKRFVEGREIKNCIVVPGRLVNIVVS